MRLSFLRLLTLAAIVGALAVSACADVVTICPSNPGDWSWEVYTASAKEKVYFTKGGPAPAEGNPFPTGNGAFYAWLDWEGGDYESTPANAWLGLDKHKGQSLAGLKLTQLKELTYVSYVSGLYNAKMGTPERRHPQQPFMLTLTITDQFGNRRQLWYMPWGPPLGWPFWNNRRAWLTIDAINMTSDPDFALGQPAPVWYEFWSQKTFYSWQEVIDFYYTNEPTRDWRLVPTSTYWDPSSPKDPLGWKSAGWGSDTTPPGDPRATATGKCLNLWVGARKASVNELGAWVQQSMNFAGYVDSFSLGVDLDENGELEPEEQTTYDFASDGPAPTVAAVCNTGQSRWNSNAPWEYPYAEYRRSMDNHFVRGQVNQHQFLYRFFGQVLDLTAEGGGPAYDDASGTNTQEFYFTIWDGTYANVSTAFDPSGKAKATVRVRWPRQDSYPDEFFWPVKVGDWVAVTGFLYDRYYSAGDATPPPAEITSSPANLQVYYSEQPE